MASRTPFKILTGFFGSQSSQATQHLLPPEAVTISKTDRHQNKLGEGSYAKVYRGQYKGLPCAVKVFSEDCLKKELSNPEHEFDLAYLGGMNHENIVKVFGLWTDPHKGRNVNAIVMELCEDSLEGYIVRHKGKIASIDQKLQILNGVCKGMIFLHGEHIVHGDLRAPNILLVTLEDQIIAKVSDFGMSRYIDPQKCSHLTSRHTDEEYLPPEVYLGKHQRTPKQQVALLTFEVDIFCFGNVALQLGCGEFPTPLNKVDIKIIGTTTVRTEIERRAKFMKKLKHSDKEVIEPIVHRCLADKPEDRPTFTDLHANIEAKLKRYKEQPDLAMLQEKIKLKQVLKDKDSVVQAKEELLRELETESNMHREKSERLANELRDLKKNLTENAGQIALKDHEIEQLKLAQKQHQNEEEQMKQKLEHAEQARKHALAEQQSNKNQLEKDLQETASALNALSEKLQKVLQEKKDLDDIQAQLKETNVKAEKEKEELKRSLQMSQLNLKQLQEQVDQWQKQCHSVSAELEETKVALQVEKDKLRSTAECVCQKEKEVKKLKGDLQSERDKVQAMEETALQKERELDQCKARKAAVEKDLVRARKMAKDLLDERVVVNAESEQKMENLNERLMKFKQQAVLSEERLKQVQGLEGEHQDLKVQLKTLTTTLEDFQKVLTDEQKSRKSLDANVKALRAEIDQLRTELKERDNEVSSLAAANKHLQRKMDAADTNSGEMKAEITQLRTELKERDNKVSSLTAANGGLQRKVNAADADITEMKKELAKQRGMFAKERQQFEEQIAAEERAKRIHQERLGEAQKKEHDLNDQLRQYRDKLEASEGAKDKLERAKEILEAEKVALEKKVRELTYKLEVRAEDLSKKENLIFNLMKELEEAQKAVAEGNELEPLLRQSIEELEDEKKELMKCLEDNVGKSKKLQRELAEAMEAQKTLEVERDQKMETIRVREVALQVERDKLHSTEESVCQKEKEVKKLKGDLRSERDKVQTLGESALQKERELDQCKARKAAVEKDLVRARKMAKDLLDEHAVVNVESEQKMENLNERLMEFKQQAVLSEERLKQVQGLEGEHQDLKVQLKTLTTTLEDFQKVLTDEQKSRKSLDASMKALTAEIDQLRTELKERDNEVSSLTAANKQLQRNVDAADASNGEMKAEIDQLRTELKERDNKVSSLTAANGVLQRKVDAADTKITEMKEKLREAEQQAALFQGKRQQLEVLESVAVELKSRLSGLMMDAPLSMTPSVSGGKDGSSAVALPQEAAQKMQQLERERDSLKAERHMYQMKWLAAEDLLEAVKSEKQSLESLREEYKKNFSEAYEVMKSLLQEQEEGGVQHPPERIKLDALMDICRYYKDEGSKEIERAAAEKQCILASKKEADERVEAMACKIAALKECIEVRDGEIKRIKAQLVPHKMEAAPVPLPSDVIDVTADEGLLQQLCYMATGIKQLLVSPDGGRFTLGSGDASLEFPPGTVEKETSVRYAVILHGPFVFPAGCKPGSVIIYLNMEGATLLKPVLLYLSHWCIKEKGEDEDTLKFASASHTLEAGQQVFEEEDDADFTRANVGVLRIRDPHCLYCVETKREKVAMYSAIAFSRYIPSEETLLFRIQLMCDSLEWNEKLTTALQLKNWEKTSDGDVVIRFQYADGQHQITASPKEMSGPGWEAAIYGQQGVKGQMFLKPLGKSKDEVEQEVISGRFPPCILYKIIYNSPEEKRIRPALLKVDLNGADVSLLFSCRIKEEMSATPPVSPAYPEPVFGAATSPIPTDTCLVHTRDILTALDHRLDAKWRLFGTFLRVEYQVMEAIQLDKGGNPEGCMLDLLSKWTSNQAAGMGTLPRTWQTVVDVVYHCGDRVLSQSVAHKHGGQLPH